MILKRAAGVLAHPVSFPGPYGIGDLGQAAYDFVDFLHKSGQKLWQILPLGPTSFGDSPYQSFSTFAGNTLLISPELLIKEGLLTEEDAALAEADSDDPQINESERSECGCSSRIDYGRVILRKTPLYQKAYRNFKAKKGSKTAYTQFCKSNRDWLEDYALFIALKNYFIRERKETVPPEDMGNGLLTEKQIMDFYYGAVWSTWPEGIAKRKKEDLSAWRTKLAEDLDYHKFLQYMFFTQWMALKRYANSLDIDIVGDLPIFVSMDSSDVWANPSLFYLDEKGYPTVVAGVPPDYFSETGQLWGNPIYNWEQHKASGYLWWIGRVRQTLEMTDVLRIDHFRGFDAYWSVPFGELTAINGKWKKGPGRALFTAIEQSLGHLPIIAEDLGVMTSSVEKLRDGLKLPGMKILQFAFEGDPANDYLPHNYSHANLVVYTGTHDNDTTAGWYEKTDEKCQDYFRRYLNVSGSNASWDMIRLAYSSVAAYAIIPLQDLMDLGSEYRMNIPGTAAGNWQFRYTQDMLAESIAEGLAYLTKLYNR